MAKRSMLKAAAKALKAAKGESTNTLQHAANQEYLGQYLPPEERGEVVNNGLSRKDNWLNRASRNCVKKLRTHYPDMRILRDRKNDDRITFVGFEELFTDVTTGVNPNDSHAIHRRACLITAQCIMIAYYTFTWEKALKYAVTGMPVVPDPDAEGGFIPWHAYVMKKMREFEEPNKRLSHSMHRFYMPPVAQRRIHARRIDPHGVRHEILEELHGMGLPEPLLEKEAQQSMNPCHGSGYPGNLEKTLQYYRKKRTFTGDLRLVRAAVTHVVQAILDHTPDGHIEPWTHERAAAKLYKKTGGRTQVGGRFHCPQSSLDKDGIDTVIAHAKSVTSFTTRMPCEVGNRFVPAKNVYGKAENGDPLVHTSISDLWHIVDEIPKDRTTYAVYKAKQINDLRLIYPLQTIMAGMEWFVALAGHDATFNVNQPTNHLALALYEALRHFDSYGASWDFSSHDALLDVLMALLYGQEEFKGCGILPQLFPNAPQEEWEWSYECGTHSTRYMEHGILFTGLGMLHGADSGEGWTNGGESLVGVVMVITSMLNTVRRLVGDLVFELIQLPDFVAKLIQSTHIVVMGDDTASVTNHPDFVQALNDGLAQLGHAPFDIDSVTPPTVSEVASDFAEFGTDPSTDARKISYFGRKSRSRMFDFTAHQCFVEFDTSGEVVRHIHGYYPFLRACASYIFAESRSPQEILISLARKSDGSKLDLRDVFNYDVIGFFVALQYSILSNTYLNPEWMMDKVFMRLMRQVPHYGGIFAMTGDAGTVAKYLANMPIRESLMEQKLTSSRVFAAMMTATEKLLEEEMQPPEIQTIIDWVAFASDVDLAAYASVRFPYAKASWDDIFAMYPSDSDPANQKSANAARRVVEDEAESAIAEAFSSSTFSSIMTSLSRIRSNA